MSDLIDEIYEKFNAANREWMRTKWATANMIESRDSGPTIFREVVGPYLQMCEDIEALRASVGDGVVIGIYNTSTSINCVACHGEWTKYEGRSFSADTLPAALRKAVAARAELEAQR